jgi:hypothetical protein
MNASDNEYYDFNSNEILTPNQVIINIIPKIKVDETEKVKDIINIFFIRIYEG